MFKEKFLIRVNYKSGIQEEFWVYEFTIDGGTYQWKNVSANARPIVLNPDRIESVYQVRSKRFF